MTAIYIKIERTIFPDKSTFHLSFFRVLMLAVFLSGFICGNLHALPPNSTTHTSKDNNTGNWEVAATWVAGNGNLSNNDIVNIYGFVTLGATSNSGLILNNNAMSFS